MHNFNSLLAELKEHKEGVEIFQEQLRANIRDLEIYIGYYDDSIASLENAIFELKKED